LGIGKQGTGKWILTGNNSFEGNAFILNGTLSVNTIDVAANNQALGKGSLIYFSNSSTTTSTLEFTGSANSVTDKQVVIGNANNGHNGGGAIVNNGNGTLTFTNATFNSLPGLAGNATIDRTLTLGGTNTGNNEIQGVIQDNVTGAAQILLAKSDAGRWILSGSNTYTGATSINDGVLQAVDGTGLPTTSILQLRGGVFQSSGTFSRNVSTAAGAVNWSTSSGGFAAIGAPLVLNLNGGNGSLTWNGSSMVQTGQTLIFGSTTADNLVDWQNALNLGSSGSGQRTIQVIDNPGSTTDRARISGAITNTAAGWGILKTGDGLLELTNTNTYNGTTTIQAGTLQISGTGSINGTSGITINGGKLDYTSSVALTQSVTFTSGTLGGTNWTGSLSGLTIGAGQTISPGNSPGTANTGSQTWATDGTYAFEVNRADGTAGGDPGWDLLVGTGTLDITATSGNPFVIDLISLDITNASGPAENFVSTQNYFWRMADFASITNFDVTKFFVNDAAFQNPTDGTFSVQLGGTSLGPVTVPGTSNQLYLTYIAVPEPGTIALLGVGVALLGFRVARRPS
jgi:autotransporter-associated beta strand protein